MIEVENLTKKFAGTTAVKDISFNVAEGEVLGFLGPNGAGKTTTMRILSGYLPPTAGRVVVDGCPIFKNPDQVRRSIGYLPENSPLYSDMRVNEYLRYRAGLKGVPSKSVRGRVEEVKEMCGLEDSGRRLIKQLSKGYRQRVGLADALVHDPKLLILDEPTIGLDPNQNRQVRSMINDLAKKHTVLISTHILSEAEMVCSRVLIINDGKIVAQDTPDNLQGIVYGGVSIHAESNAAVADLEYFIRQINGVESVEVEDGGEWKSVKIGCMAGVDVRAEIFSLASNKNWLLRELRREAKSLEDVFVSLTSRGDN